VDCSADAVTVLRDWDRRIGFRFTSWARDIVHPQSIQTGSGTRPTQPPIQWESEIFFFPAGIKAAGL